MEAVGRLAVWIAHDFNNLLTAILGFGTIVRSGIALESDISGDVDELLKAAEKARRLTQQLLAFSRKQGAPQTTVDGNDVVCGLHGMLRRLVRENIEIEVDLQPAGRPIIADPVQMEQAILNLTVNACDAMPDGGPLRIATRDSDRAMAWCSQSATTDWENMRVIYMSGYSEAATRHTARTRDACWIRKPFSPREFLSEVQLRLEAPRTFTVIA